jgi:hypothetical protein
LEEHLESRCHRYIPEAESRYVFENLKHEDLSFLENEMVIEVGNESYNTKIRTEEAIVSFSYDKDANKGDFTIKCPGKIWMENTKSGAVREEQIGILVS